MTSSICLSILQQFVQQDNVNSMFHYKLSIQVEDRYVPPVPVKPHLVLLKTDVHLLQDKLWDRQRHTLRDFTLSFLLHHHLVYLLPELKLPALLSPGAGEAD